MIEIRKAYRMRGELKATKVADPGEAGAIGNNYFFGGTSRSKRERDGPQPGRPIGGRAFLIEGFCFRSIDETLENDRAISYSSKSACCDRQVITHEIEFGYSYLF